MALLRAKHDQGRDHGKRDTLQDAAKEAGLDLERFERDRKDRSRLHEIGDDYTEASDRLGVFGTPTFVFPNGDTAYLKMLPPAPPEDAVAVFEEFVQTVRERPYISEIKRPPKPSAE